MKYNLNKIPALCCLLLAAVFMFSCEEDDNKKEWGNTKVYMPQAAMLNGGLTNNNYPVPLNNNAATKNYKLDEANKILQVYLGVYRSGLQKLESYSVQVAADNAATASYVAGNANRIALPSDAYTLPDNATVPDGERETIFYLTVDLKKLGEDFLSKNIVLIVGISNPSKYELNESLSKTTVIINGSFFLPNE